MPWIMKAPGANPPAPDFMSRRCPADGIGGALPTGAEGEVLRAHSGQQRARARGWHALRSLARSRRGWQDTIGTTGPDSMYSTSPGKKGLDLRSP
jgi:hypothetical protein